MRTVKTYEVKPGDVATSIVGVEQTVPRTCVRVTEHRGRTTVIFWDNGGFFPTHGNDDRTIELVR